MSIKRAVFEYIQYLLYHEIFSSLLKECNRAVPFGTYQYMQHDLLSIAARYRGVYKYAILLWQKVHVHVSLCMCVYTHPYTLPEINKILCCLKFSSCQMHLCFYTTSRTKDFYGVEEQRLFAGD